MGKLLLCFLALATSVAHSQGPGYPPGDFMQQDPWKNYMRRVDVPVDRILQVGEKLEVSLGARYFVKEVIVQAVSLDYVGASFHLFVNGQQRGPWQVPGRDPDYTIPVGMEASDLAVVSAGIQGTQQGRLRITGIRAHVFPTDYERRLNQPWPNPPDCPNCPDLDFPLYFKTVLGNLSNRAIVLVDRLQGFTDHRAFQKYLWPIKVAAAEARSNAEVYGDAYSGARVYYDNLMLSLDFAQPYLRNMYERQNAFAWATELLSLREKIRRTIGPSSTPAIFPVSPVPGDSGV